MPDIPTTEPPGGAELAARAGIVAGALALLGSIALLLTGSVYQPEAGLLGVLLSDDLALLLITAASSAHLILVPSICVAIALRDKRRLRAGHTTPAPRSRWKGDSQFIERGSDLDLAGGR